MNLTKQESQAIKGIAIWFMLGHHLFYNPDNFRNMEVKFFLNTDLMISIASFAKICVPIFVFITAYGMAAKYDESRCSKIEFEKIAVKRYVSLMIPFIFIFIFMQAICNIVRPNIFFEIYGSGVGSIVYFLFDGMGMAYIMGTPTLNPTWWYMSLALLLIVVMPIIYMLCNRFGYTFFFSLWFFFRAVNWHNGGILVYYIIASLAVITYKTNFFVVIHNLFYKRKIKIIMLPVMALILAGCYVLYIKNGYTDIVFCISTIVVILLYKEYISYIKVFSIFLQFCGRHSMNIFLTHTFIFSILFHDFIYSFKYDIIILLVLMGASLVASFVINIGKKAMRIDKLQQLIILNV